MKPNRFVQNISSKKELTQFFHLLLDDYRSNKESWENQDLDAFLEAIAAWIMDMDGYYANKGADVPQQPTWRMIGEMMLAAKYYE